VLKEHKVASKVRTRSKLLVRSVIVVLVGGEVALRVIVAKIATWLIKQLLWYNLKILIKYNYIFQFYYK
jgi:hypothetical protein